MKYDSTTVKHVCAIDSPIDDVDTNHITVTGTVSNPYNQVSVSCFGHLASGLAFAQITLAAFTDSTHWIATFVPPLLDSFNGVYSVSAMASGEASANGHTPSIP